MLLVCICVCECIYACVGVPVCVYVVHMGMHVRLYVCTYVCVTACMCIYWRSGGPINSRLSINVYLGAIWKLKVLFWNVYFYCDTCEEGDGGLGGETKRGRGSERAREIGGAREGGRVERKERGTENGRWDRCGLYASLDIVRRSSMYTYVYIYTQFVVHILPRRSHVAVLDMNFAVIACWGRPVSRPVTPSCLGLNIGVYT